MGKYEKTRKTEDSAYYESKRHSDTMFAFNIYPCTIPKDFSFVPLHWQDSAEIIYVKRGRGIIRVDHDVYTAECGDIFLILPGRLHGMQSIPKNSMEYENMIFDMNFLGVGNIDACSRKYLQPMINGKLQVPVYIRKEDEMYREAAGCLDAVDELCETRLQGYELGVKGKLMILFSLLAREAMEENKSGMGKAEMEKLKMVLSRIECDYDKKMTVKDMADECGYSESHFMRWFRDAAGISFYGYLIAYRLEKAACALRSGNDSILQVAEQSGFDNLSNFNRLFRKKFEMTPSQFRKSDHYGEI